MIFVDDSEIKVSGTVIPGIISSLEIKDAALVEEQDVEGSSIKAKQAQGYEDAKITIEIMLEDGPEKTKMEKLDSIQNLFKKAGQDKPVVHEIINEHTAARRIKDVIFKSLGTKEDNKTQRLYVSLEFWSYNTMTITASKSGGSSKGSLDSAFQSYMNNKNSATASSASPATDDTESLSAKAALMGLPF